MKALLFIPKLVAVALLLVLANPVLQGAKFRVVRDGIAPIPLYKAVRSYDYAALKAALEAGQVDVNAIDEQGNTGLHIVAIEELYDFRGDSLLNLILTHGADAKLQNKAGRTAISYIDEVAKGVGFGEHEYGVPLGLLTDAMYDDIDIKGGEGDNRSLEDALHWDNYLRDVEQIRQQVADLVNTHSHGLQGYGGKALLDLLRMPEHPYSYVLGLSETLHAAAILVMHGDAFNAVLTREGIAEQIIAEKGEYLLKLATSWGNKEVVEALLDHGVDPSLGLFDASYTHRQWLTKLEHTYTLWEDSVDRFRLARRGGGTIIIDANDPNHDILKLLIARGADIDARHPRGYSPLHLATEAGDPLAVEILLANEAKPNIADRFGRTPLHWSTSRPAWIGFEITAMLLAHGADANVRDDDVINGDDKGFTPYDYLVKQYEKGWTRGKRLAAAGAALLAKQAADAGQIRVEVWGKSTLGAGGVILTWPHKSDIAIDWAKRSGNETIQKIVSGEMAIEQLLNREIRQQVVAELRQLGLEDEQ